MVTIEQIDEFRRRTNSSYEDARFFLDRHQGDVLEAIIDFEKAKGASGAQAQSPKKGEFGPKVAEIIQKGFDLRMTVEDKVGSMLFTVPILVLLLLTPVWPMILITCLGLIFLGYKLGFKDIKTPTVDVKDIFENLGRQFQDVGRQQGTHPRQQSPGQQNPGQHSGQQNTGRHTPQGQPYAPQSPVQPWQTAASPPPDETLNSGVLKPVDDGFKVKPVDDGFKVKPVDDGFKAKPVDDGFKEYTVE